MAIKASENIFGFIKGEEDFVAGEYDDGFGNKTQGYGMTTGLSKKPKTREEADADMRARVRLAEEELSRNITRDDLTQGQMDVLIDKHYNMGLTNMKGFIDLVNSRQDDLASAEILKYTKAFNKHTGKYEDAPGLHKRVKKRASMWSQKSGSPSNDILADVLSSVDSLEAPDDPLVAALQEVDQEGTEMANQVDPARVKQGLKDMSEIADPEEALRNSEARRLSKQLGISLEESKSRLIEKDYNTILTEQSHDIIAQNFPAIAEWVNRDPDNYVMLKESGNWAPRVELAARNTRRDDRSDWAKSLDQNRLMIKESLTYLGMLRGQQSVEEGKKILLEVDQERRGNALSSKSARTVQQVFDDPESSFLDKLDIMFKHPEATMQIMGQSQGSTVAIMGASITAGLAGTSSGGPIVGAGAGAVSAYTVSHLLSYAEHMTKQLDEFRDPITGNVNIDLAYSDPERVKRWQREADIYGLSMGTSDAIFSLLGGALGKGVAKYVFKSPATTVAGKVARKATEIGAEGTAKMAEEGGSQLVASTAVDVHRGDGLKNLAENLKEAENEALLSSGPGLGMTAIRHGAAKTMDVLKKANRANEDLVAVSELRREVHANENASKNPEQTKELLTQTLNPRSEQDDPNDPIMESTDELIPSQVRTQEKQAVMDTTSISPVEFEAHYGSREKALEALQAFGPEVVQAYARARGTDTSVQIPTADWVLFTQDDPEIDAIARFNGNEMNALEANAEIEKIEARPTTFFEQTVYHGSPYDFDRFKETAINTGEGAQAFGYGLYFSSDKNVAEWYRKSLTPTNGQIPKYVADVIKKYDNFGFDRISDAVQAFRENPDWVKEWDASELDDNEILAINNYLAPKPKGQVFEVKIPDGHWMDLDSTLDSIPPENINDLRDALKQVVKKEQSEEKGWNSVETSMKKPDYLFMFIDGKPINNEYVTVGSLISSLTADEDKALAPLLASKGFNGFKYTGLESGKSNFVVFTEDDAKIVKKFYEGEPDNADIEIVEGDPNEPSNLKMRPVALYSRFRNEDERKVFNSIGSRLRKALPKDFDPKAIEVFTELQYRHMKSRSEMLGVPMDKIGEMLKIGKTKKSESDTAYGVFRHNNLKDSPYTVAFSPEADAKTLVHEFAHSWLYEMALDYSVMSGINPETMTVSQREYAMAMQSMAQLAGLKNIGELLNIDRAQETNIHERFARTVEMYFLEGKFEDNNMKFLMESFRKWMTAIIHRIKSIANWSSYPPMKITPQIERMMEAILGANEYVDGEMVPMMPEPKFDPKILGEQGADYVETILQARSAAIGSAYAKMFNKGIKEREVQIDRELNRIQEQAIAEVDAQRSMILLAGFKDAYQEHKNDPEGDIPDPRLEFESVVKVLFNGNIAEAENFKAKVPREFIASKKKGPLKKGIPVETFMQLQGIESRQELLDMITEASQREELIEKKMDEIIDRDFPALKSDEEIHELAVLAVQNDGREKLLLKEIDIMMTKYKGQYKTLVSKLINPPAYIGKPTRDNLQKQGDKLVLDSNAYKFTAAKFLKDSNRHGREASRRFRKNNIIEALQSSVDEAVHFFGYKTALKAQKAVAGTTLRIKQFGKYARSKDLARKFDADVMAFGKQIVQLAGHGQKLPYLTREGFSPLTGLSEAHIVRVNKAIDTFHEVSQGRYGKNASVAGYVQLGQLLKELVFVASEAKGVEIANRRMQIDDAGDAIVTEIGDGSVVDVSGKGFASTLRQSVVNVRTMFESLYSSPEAFSASTLGKVFYAVTNAEAKRSVELQKYREKISAAVRLTMGDSGIVAPLVNRLPIPASWKMDDKNAKPILMTTQDGFAKEFTFKNKGELHMANLLMGSESGAKKFLLGHGLVKPNPDNEVEMLPDFDSWNNFIERMIQEGALTKKDFDMYNAIWAIFEEIHPLVKAVMRKTDGFNMGKIEGQKVKNSLGEFTGGYVPVVPVRELMGAGMVDSLLEVDSMGYRVDSLYPSMNTGMTNERSEQYAELNLDMSRLNTYLSAALNIAYLREPLLNFGKVMELPQVRNAIEARRPGAYGDSKGGMIVRWFNAVKAQEYTEFSTDVHEKIARHLRMNVNLAMYLGAWTTVVKQFFGFAPAMARVGARNLIVSNLRTGLGARKSIRQEIFSKSVMMQNRLANSQEQMIRSWDQLETNFDWVSWTGDKVNTFQWFFIQMTQNMVDTSTWYAGYTRAINKGLSEEAAINFADDAVRATQSSPDVSNMSNIQRGKDSHKLIMMVTSVPISMNNLMQADMMRDQAWQNKAKALTTVAMLAVVLPGILDGIFAEATDDDEIEDEEDMNEAIGLVALRTAMGSIDAIIPIPYVRMATSAIQFGTGSVTPGLSKPASAIAKSVKGVQNLGRGVDLNAKEIAGLMDTATILTGLPASIVGRVFTYHEQFLLDEREKEDRAWDRRDQMADARDN